MVSGDHEDKEMFLLGEVGGYSERKVSLLLQMALSGKVTFPFLTIKKTELRGLMIQVLNFIVGVSKVCEL